MNHRRLGFHEKSVDREKHDSYGKQHGQELPVQVIPRRPVRNSVDRIDL